MCLVSIAGFGIPAAAQKTAKPNIIFILADDLGYGDLGCYGQQKIATPNIDKLAKMGVKFTQFYSGSTVCAPARCTFLTGMHTGHGVIRGNVTIKPEGQIPLPDSIVTFPMLLQKAGYTTAAFGKWSLGFITTSGDPQKKGFDEFYGYNCQTLAHNYYPDHLWHNHDKIDLAVNLKTDSVYSADLIHQQAMNFLNSKHDKPFFLYLPYTLPHADVIVPHDDVYNYYVKKFAEHPVTVKKSKDDDTHYDAYPHAAYAAMVARLDKYVGEIMQLLKENGMEENTLLIFTSDNGPHKEKGGDPAFFNSSAGFKGIKRDLYEGGIREPFIAYQKGVTKPGTINPEPAALWDMFPTFLQLANQPIPKNIDGISILSSIKGLQQKSRDYFYWELHESGGKQAVRMGDWKGVKLNVSTSSTSPVELYDLKNDPHEKYNIAAQHPDIVSKIEAIMKEAYVPNKDWPLMPEEGKSN
ncbi:MAG: arylsulfatase [Bacteroidota bacterium]|nr:arylsulfatase [Bacteroidota bacterium]